jgi:hypothetical protein
MCVGCVCTGVLCVCVYGVLYGVCVFLYRPALLLLLLFFFFSWPVLGVPRRLSSPGPLSPMTPIIWRGGALLLPRSDSRSCILLHPLSTLLWKSVAP